MNKTYDPNNGQIDNVDEFLGTSSFDDEPEQTGKQCFSDTDTREIQQMIDESVNARIGDVFESVNRRLKHTIIFHMNAYIDHDYPMHLYAAFILETLLIDLEKHHTLLSAERMMKIDTEYDVTKKHFDRHREKSVK